MFTCAVCDKGYNNLSAHYREHPECKAPSPVACVPCEPEPLVSIQATAIADDARRDVLQSDVARDRAEMRYGRGLEVCGERGDVCCAHTQADPPPARRG